MTDKLIYNYDYDYDDLAISYTSSNRNHHTNYYCSEISCCNQVNFANSYCSQHKSICCGVSCNIRIAYCQNYCSFCKSKYDSRSYSERLYNEQESLKALVRQRTSLTNPQEVERFSTNWNKNLATVVNSSGYYRVFLLVLDEDGQVRIFPADTDNKKWGEYNNRQSHNYLYSAKEEAEWLREKLKYSDNPILLIHPSADGYTSFTNVIVSPYVKIDYNAYPSEFKPLDITWIDRGNYYHVAVYIGNGELIEYTNDWNSDEAVLWRGTPFRGGIVRKTNWNGFLGQDRSIRRYHPIIPFKKYQEIIGQLVWAKDADFRKGEYNLANRNCEHFAKNVC